MKLFLVQPGTVVSKNDWDLHWIGPRQLMSLYRVDPSECVIDDATRVGYSREYLNALMPLAPLSGADYRPVSEREREAQIEKLSGRAL